MFIYEIAIGLGIYVATRILNYFRFDKKPMKKYAAIILSIFIFIALFVFYFNLRLYFHEQAQIASGVKFDQKKFFSIGQSIIGAIIFYLTIKKPSKQF
jgi:hypothetical protein